MAKEIDELQGVWKIISLEMDGKALTGSGMVSIKGNKFVSTGMGAEYEGTVKVNASAVPKTFDLKFTTGPEKGNTNRGIYELTGDRWKICLATRGAARPKVFTAPPGTGIVVEVLERSSETEEAKPPEKDWIDDLGFEPASELEGEWAMVSGSFDGMPMDKNFVKLARRVVEACEVTVTFGQEMFSKGKYTVNRSTTPPAIDIHNKKGMHAGKVQRGIYEVSGKMLHLSLAGAGRERPRDFSSNAGDGRTVVVWKKISG